MKSKLDQQIEDTFYYAVNFYSTNDRSIEKQQFCLTEMQKYGLDLDTCIRIQNPIMSVFQMGELMQIGSELTQQHLNSITNSIRQHLLGLQPTLKPETIKELPNIPTVGGVGKGSNKRDIDGVSVQVKNIVQDVSTNGYKGQKALVMSNYDLEPHDMNYLSATMPSNKYNFTLVDFGHNPRIKPLGLDYLLKGSPGILSLQQGNTDISVMYQGMLTRPSFNIVKLNLGNCNLGDTGADILCHALANGKLPSAKNIDISGNNITQTGDTWIVQKTKGVYQDFVIFTHTLDEIVKKSGDEGKEVQVKALKSIIERGKAIGTYDEALIVDKSFFGKAINSFKDAKVSFKWLVGFGKCHLLPDPKEEVESYAQDKIVATLPTKTASGLNFAKKYAGKLLNFHDFMTCFVDTREDAVTSELGMDVAKHQLCVVGEHEFCGDQ